MKAWLVGSNCSAVPFIANILVQCKGNIRIFADFFRREMAEFSWLYHQTGIARPIQLLILKKYDFCWTNWISWCISPFSAKTIFSFVCIKVKRRDLIRWRSVQYVRPTKIIDVEIEGNTNVLRELKVGTILRTFPEAFNVLETRRSRTFWISCTVFCQREDWSWSCRCE